MKTETNALTIAEKIHAAFEEGGQRQTQPRSLIASRLAEMADRGKDFTVEELWHDLQRSDPHLGRATVFRAVEMLAGLGLLHRIEFEDGSHVYRACGDGHHHHLTCVQCHRVVDIDVCLEEKSLAKVGAQHHFVIEGHTLTLYGLCPDCRKES
jgi:Fur family ferric uptake transcriptional regulator